MVIVLYLSYDGSPATATAEVDVDMVCSTERPAMVLVVGGILGGIHTVSEDISLVLS